MPIYQYVCTECGSDLEARQSFSDDPLTDCPSCARPALRKQFNSVGVVFKGSGFYRNDSRSGNSTELSKNDSSNSKADKNGKSEPASESKPETKSDSKSESTAKKPETKSSGKAKATNSAG